MPLQTIHKLIEAIDSNENGKVIVIVAIVSTNLYQMITASSIMKQIYFFLFTDGSWEEDKSW